LEKLKPCREGDPDSGWGALYRLHKEKKIWDERKVGKVVWRKDREKELHVAGVSVGKEERKEEGKQICETRGRSPRGGKKPKTGNVADRWKKTRRRKEGVMA